MKPAIPAMARSIFSAGGRSLAAMALSRSLARLKIWRSSEDLDVEGAFAPEVVVEHGLVHAGAAGDAIDARAGVAALCELQGGGGEDAIGRNARGSAHIN